MARDSDVLATGEWIGRGAGFVTGNRVALVVTGLAIFIGCLFILQERSGGELALRPEKGPGTPLDAPGPLSKEVERSIASDSTRGASRSPESSEGDSSGTSPQVTLVGSFLSDFWGKDWPEIEAEMRSMGNTSLLEFELRTEDMPPPWEDVESILARLLAERIDAQRLLIPGRLEAGMAWPEPVTRDFLIQQTGLGLSPENFDDEDLARVLRETDWLRQEIAARETELVDAYKAACARLLRAGEYGKAMFFYGPSVERALTRPEHEVRERWSPTMVLYRGWMVSFQPYKDENPSIRRMVAELRPLYNERDKTVKAALRR